MKQILTIAGLTWRAAFRYRLFWVLTVLLIAAVVGLPLLLKDDGSAQGLTQILLTYTLSAITALLGFATLWLACGTLARDIEDSQMQVVSVKPIARWQIWVGKWIGVVALNAALLAISGASVYVLLKVRAQRLPPEQRAILEKEIFVARASIKERPKNIDADVETRLKELIKDGKIEPALIPQAREHLKNSFLSQLQVVPDGVIHTWVIDFGPFAKQIRNQPLAIRYKFNSANPNPALTYEVAWQVGPRDSANLFRDRQFNIPPNSFQEFEIPANLIDADGKLTIEFGNYNPAALLFALDDGMEVLYREGSFGLNYIRGLGIILCWLGLLATIGLAAASWLSFPVAAFFSISVLFMGLSSGTLASVVEQGTIFGLDHETGAPIQPAFDGVLMPIFQGALTLIKLVESFSPVDSLSTGRSITWDQLGLAVLQIVFLMGGFFALIGIFLFSRRELAAVQSNN